MIEMYTKIMCVIDFRIFFQFGVQIRESEVTSKILVMKNLPSMDLIEMNPFTSVSHQRPDSGQAIDPTVDQKVSTHLDHVICIIKDSDFSRTDISVFVISLQTGSKLERQSAYSFDSRS